MCMLYTAVRQGEATFGVGCGHIITHSPGGTCGKMQELIPECQEAASQRENWGRKKEEQEQWVQGSGS